MLRKASLHVATFLLLTKWAAAKEKRSSTGKKCSFEDKCVRCKMVLEKRRRLPREKLGWGSDWGCWVAGSKPRGRAEDWHREFLCTLPKMGGGLKNMKQCPAVLKKTKNKKPKKVKKFVFQK